MIAHDKVKPLPLLHFPAGFQAVIWRNWNLVPVERLAKVLHVSADEIRNAGKALGLECCPDEWKLWEKHGYQTIVIKYFCKNMKEVFPCTQ